MATYILLMYVKNKQSQYYHNIYQKGISQYYTTYIVYIKIQNHD